MTAEEYTAKQENYLPERIHDFHKQKNMFKTIHELYGEHEGFKSLPNSWMDNHIFTLDILLKFFAMHGYKLQKIRKPDVEFFDLHQTLSEYAKRRAERSAKMLQEALSSRKVDKPTHP